MKKVTQSRANKTFYQVPRYRSVKYRVSNSQLVVGNQIGRNLYTKSINQQRKQMGKSSHALGTSLRKIKGIHDIESFNTTGVNRFESVRYLEAFNEMVNSEKQVKLNRSPVRESRVYLPMINDDNASKFILLDPIAWPINYIEVEIQKTKEELEREKQALKRVREQIPIFQANELRKISQIEIESLQGIKRLEKLLTANKVLQQQTVLKAKKSVAQLQSFIPEHKQEFQQTHKRVVDLQQTIFNLRPFELEQKEEYEAISSKFF